MRIRPLPALVLAAALTTAGCQHPDGSTDWGSTLALGAGVGLAAGAVAALASDRRDGRRDRNWQPRGYDRGSYSSYGRGGRAPSGPSYGYGRRGW